MTSSRVPTPLTRLEGNTAGTSARVPVRPGAVADLGMCGRSLYGNREISWLANRCVTRSALVRVGERRRHAFHRVRRQHTIPIARPLHCRCPTPRDFVPWGLSNAGLHGAGWARHCRHPKCFTSADEN
jgi:hypothetical protein